MIICMSSDCADDNVFNATLDPSCLAILILIARLLVMIFFRGARI